MQKGRTIGIIDLEYYLFGFCADLGSMSTHACFTFVDLLWFYIIENMFMSIHIHVCIYI